MDHTPPPFFKRGPAPLVRLFFFATLSLALLVIDARFRYVEGLRSWLALAAYPIQRAALLPFDAGERLELKAVPAEILYASRDPYAHKIFIDRGQVQDIRPGSPVTDETGL